MTSLQPSFGWAGPAPIDILVTNRSTAAVAVGDVLMLDNRRADAASTSNTAGSSAAGIANVIAQIAFAFDSQSAGVYCVMQQASADDGPPVRARLSGHCDLVACNAAVVLVNARGIPLSGGASNQLRIVSAATETTGGAAAFAQKVIFLPLVAIGAAGTTSGWFNGITGFGTVLVT